MCRCWPCHVNQNENEQKKIFHSVIYIIGVNMDIKEILGWIPNKPDELSSMPLIYICYILVYTIQQS